ncbi:MAG: tRNA 2-thiouridine(34) synthase MnmA [Candidatus Buchananbacteria bacterium]
MINKPKKVCIAMSGGVDSSLAAALLKNQGYDCIGIFLKFWQEPAKNCGIENKCCSQPAYEDAKKVAHKLGFPLYTLNFSQPFKKAVVDDFLAQFKKGCTPNPCVACNKFIKFGLLLKKAKLFGCDYLATGHYVKIKKDKTGNFILQTAKDKQKDQSYFLYNLKQNQLKQILFPLSDLTKPQVRQLAKKFNLSVYQKPESQEICFVPEKNHYSFLKRNLKLKPGPIKNPAGQILGWHDGLPLYTLGQRRGIKIGGPGPFYVIKLDYKNNTLIVSNSQNDKNLLTKKFQLKNINWLSGKAPKPNTKLGVKIRYQAKTIPANFSKNIVTLKTPQRAVMPGQSAVFYQGKTVLGGGIISRLIS